MPECVSLSGDLRDIDFFRPVLGSIKTNICKVRSAFCHAPQMIHVFFKTFPPVLVVATEVLITTIRVGRPEKIGSGSGSRATARNDLWARSHYSLFLEIGLHHVRDEPVDLEVQLPPAACISMFDCRRRGGLIWHSRTSRSGDRIVLNMEVNE